MQVNSIGDNHYYVWFKDDHSTFKILFCMKHKSDVFQLFKMLQHISFITTSNWIKKLTTDFGREFIKKEFEEYLLFKGIQQKTIALYCLEHNGVAKRDNCTIVEMARSVLYAKNLHLKFWLCNRAMTIDFVFTSCVYTFEEKPRLLRMF